MIRYDRIYVRQSRFVIIHTYFYKNAGFAPLVENTQHGGPLLYIGLGFIMSSTNTKLIFDIHIQTPGIVRNM